ncbi:unnamed protein product, partial [Prunus brigantina]
NFDSCIPSQILVFNFLFFLQASKSSLSLSLALSLLTLSTLCRSLSQLSIHILPPLSQSHSAPLLSQISLPLWALI